MVSQPLSAFARIEEQLDEERLSALTRIGQRLDMLLQSLDEITTRCRETAGPERDRAVDAYRIEYEQARLYRWYLEVQRESVGLCRHESVDRVFPLPPPVPPDTRS